MLLVVILEILILTIFSFFVAFFSAPILTKFLYKYHLGKRIRSPEKAPIYAQLHKDKAGTPTMGGILIWGTTLFLSLTFFYLSKLTNFDIFNQLNFLNRKETLLPLGVLVASALIGLLDDLFNLEKPILGKRGLTMGHRLLLYTFIAAIGAWWFYVKLERDSIYLPFFGDLNLGLFYVLFFIFIIVATAFSVNETDGLDGLAGGTLLTSFGAYGTIAFIQGRYDLTTFCGVIVGALVAFLWFNIYPARFFMGDTGAMSLGVSLGVLAMFTNQVMLLPIIGFIFLIESLSVIVQVISKKLRKKKIFLSTPIHHHFEAIGWPEPKVVMRFWLISGLSAVSGLIIFLIERIL